MMKPGLSLPNASKAAASTADLVAAGLAEAGAAAALAEVEAHYTVRLTPEILRQIRQADQSDPLFRQYVPSTEELAFAAGELEDPTGDGVHEKVKGLIHRYPDRVLLKPTLTCLAYCRFCFRREKVGQGEANLTEAELDAAFGYIAAHPEIYEVILSGGDPLALSSRRLSSIMARLSAIPHVRVIRIHTRVPMVAPERIDDTLLAALTARPMVYVAVHVNHAQELSDAVCQGLVRLRAAGIPLLAQTVLLRGVNDTATVLETLFRALLALGVLPYYLHHPDQAKGTGHFRLSIADGQAIMRQLRGRLSGPAIPTYIFDIPGGHGKVPVGPTYLEGANGIADPWGRQHKITE